MRFVDYRPSLHALGWAALWSTTLVQAVRHLPVIHERLVWSFVLASLATFAIWVVQHARGVKSQVWMDGKARMTFLVSTVVILLPELIQRSTR